MMPQFFENPLLTKQIKFPRSKKKRVRKKWSLDPKNHIPDPSVYVLMDGRMIVGHPTVIRRIKESIRSTKETINDTQTRTGTRAHFRNQAIHTQDV